MNTYVIEQPQRAREKRRKKKKEEKNIKEINGSIVVENQRRLCKFCGLDGEKGLTEGRYVLSDSTQISESPDGMAQYFFKRSYVLSITSSGFPLLDL